MSSFPGWFWVQVSHDIIVKLRTSTAVLWSLIWRLNWRWRIYSEDGSLLWLWLKVSVRHCAGLSLEQTIQERKTEVMILGFWVFFLWSSLGNDIVLLVTYSIGYTDQSCHNVGGTSNSDDLRMSELKKNKEGVRLRECGVREVGTYRTYWSIQETYLREWEPGFLMLWK